MFSRRTAKCRGATLGQQRKRPSASSTVVVHLAESSRSPSDRSHEGIARHCHIVFRESFLVVIASHVLSVLSSTTSSHCPPSTVAPRCEPTRLVARSSVHGPVHGQVRDRAAPRRLVLRVLGTRVYIRERVCAFLGRVRTCM